MQEKHPRPAYLDGASPQQGLISYHAEQARAKRQLITEMMLFELEHLRGLQTSFVNPSDWWAHMETLKWDDSILAIWRDEMQFHERCVLFLTTPK